MGEKIELGTGVGLSDSFKNPLESHGRDCTWHECTFVYVFLQVSLIILMQGQRQWRIKFIQDWDLARESCWGKTGERTWASWQRTWNLSSVGGEMRTRGVWARTGGLLVPVRFIKLFESWHESKLHREEVWNDERIIEMKIVEVEWTTSWGGCVVKMPLTKKSEQ